MCLYFIWSYNFFALNYVFSHELSGRFKQKHEKTPLLKNPIDSTAVKPLPFHVVQRKFEICSKSRTSFTELKYFSLLRFPTCVKITHVK